MNPYRINRVKTITAIIINTKLTIFAFLKNLKENNYQRRLTNYGNAYSQRTAKARFSKV